MWDCEIASGLCQDFGLHYDFEKLCNLFLVPISLCSISSPRIVVGLREDSGLHYYFAQPCNPILVPYILQPIVLTELHRLYEDCRIVLRL